METYGRLTLIEVSGRNKHGRLLWKCACECGGTKIAPKSDITSGRISSCGCIRPNHPLVPGQIFGRLTIISKDPTSGKARYICRCVCGKHTSVGKRALVKGDTKSCGCLRRDTIVALNTTHDEAKKTKEYNTWNGIKQRCYNPKASGYADYGGRGIAVSPLWLDDYDAFLAHVGRAPSLIHSISRIDNDGNYEPGNVEWSLVIPQNRNKRNSMILTIDGVTKHLVEWAAETGMVPGTIRYRIHQGWSTYDAVFMPPR